MKRKKEMRKLLAYSTALLCILYGASVAELKAQNRKSLSGTEVTETFRPKGGNELRILALGIGKPRVAPSATYVFKMADG